MKSSRRQKALNHFCLLLFAFILISTLSVFAGPGKTTYQAKIVKPDGYPLEVLSVNFKFTILDPTGSCILYSETYSSVNMSGTGGLISFALGSGVKTYPASATTFEQVFSNITPSLSCDVGGPTDYMPAATDIRKIVMQFHDGSGWQTLPAMSINAVPYAMYANEATKLNGLTSSDFVQLSTVPTCAASEALRYTGAGFTCVAVGNSVTSGTVVTALGYTPADGVSVTALASNVSSVSSTVFSVSSTVTSLQNSVAASFAAIISSQWTTSGTDIFYAGNVGVGTTTPVTMLDVSGGVRIGAESTTCAPALAGTLRYNASNVEYCNGTSWQAFGVSGSGITNFNGSASGTQSFAIGTAGTAPNFVTANGVHTLNIPLASAGSVTAGLISNADYTTFTNKITSSAASIAQVLGYIPADNAASGTYAQKANNLSDLTNITTARTNLGLGTFATANSIDLGSASATGTLNVARLPAFTGDATITAASNTIILSNSGVTAGTYTKVTVDNKGRVTSSSALVSSDVTTALGYTPASATAATQWTTSGSAIYYNTGSVGIGTVAPATALDVLGIISSRSSSTWGSGANSTFKAVDSNGLLFSLGLDAGNTKLELNTQYATMPIIFSVGNSEKMRITSSNYVGIGTTAPTAKMHVQDGAAVIKGTGSTLTVKKGFGTPNTLSTESVASFDNESGSGVAVNFFGNSAQPASIYMGDTANPQQGAIKYLVHSAIPTSQYMSLSTSSTERLRIDYFGNVGIGTTAPTAKLHLASGTTSVAPLKFTSGTLLASPQSGTMEYDGANFYLTDSTSTRRAIATGSSAGTIDNAANINSSGNITLTPTGSVVVSSTTASTNSQTGALVVKGGLGVAGNIYASGTIVTSSNIQGVSVTATSGMISPYIAGSVVSGGSLTVDSTAHATKGNILLAPNGGNVGVGTTAPGYKLQINAAGTSDLMLSTGADDSRLYLTDTNRSLRGVPGGAIAIQTGATERMRIDSLGNVGIGVTNPAAKLSVIGARQNTITPSNSIFQVGGDDVFLYAGAQPAGSYAVMLQAMRNSDGFSFPIALNPNGGNVGIGTTSPNINDASGTALHIHSSTGRAAGIRFTTSGTGAAAMDGVVIGKWTDGQYGNGPIFWNYEPTPITFATSSSERLIISGSGNVGIGTTSPTTVLDIRTSVSSSVKMADGAIEVQRDETSSSNTGGYIDLKKNSSEDYRVRMYYNSSGGVSSEGGLSIVTSSSGGAGSDKMFISANGNVGIGTSMPSVPLHVVSAGVSGWNSVVKVETTAANAHPLIMFRHAGGDTGYVGFGDGGTTNGFGVYNYLNADLTLGTSSTTMMTFKPSGNIGIGTTNPQSKLHVYSSTNSVTPVIEGNDPYINSGLRFIDNGQSTAGKVKEWSIWHGRDGGTWASGLGFMRYDAVNPCSGGICDTSLFLHDNGNIGVGTMSPSERLHVAGNLRVQGSTDCTLGNGAGGTNCSSDVRLKENIKPIPYALEKVISLKGVEFDWNAKSISHGRHDIGVIAQDVEKVFPSAVIDDKNTGYKKVDYAVLVAPLIQAVKELYNMIMGEKDRNVQRDSQLAQTENAVRKLAHENQELKVENAEKTKQLNEIRAYLCAKDPKAPICK